MNATKRKRTLMLVISSFFLVVGCTNKDIIIDNNEDETTLDNEIEGIENDIEKQVNIIFNSSDLWELSDEVVGDFCEKDDCKGFGYAITDLDEDGFIEVIKSLYSGNGHFSRNIIYEVTEDGNIIQWDSELEECYSEPDLLSMNELIVCDISSDKFIYYVDDFESWGVSGEANRYGLLEVSSNTVKYNEEYREELAYFPEDNKASYYRGDIELTVEQYNELVEERNKCSNRKKLKWFTEISYENIMESYEVSKKE